MSLLPTISVVIPIYNCEKYIRRCVDSILNQTYKDYEILLLDNGSTDGTLDILLEYKAKYPELIHVDSHENIGVANNRNLGITLSKGKYLMFIDADDYVLPDYCETYFREIDGSDYDSIYGGYMRIDRRGVVRNKVALRETYWAKYLLVVPWAKIHRADFIKTHNIKYADTYGEDMVFTVHELCHTEKIKVIKYIGYVWYYNEESITNTIYKGFSKDINVIAMLEKINALPNGQNDYSRYFMIRSVMYYLLASGRTGTKEDFLKVYRQLFTWLTENCPGFEKDKYLLWGPDGEYFKTNVIVLIFTIIRRLNMIKLFAKIYCKGK